MMSALIRPFGVCVLGLFLCGQNRARAADTPLLENMPQANQIPARDAALTIAGDTIRVATGHKEQWPGFTLNAPGGQWDWSKYGAVTLDVKNTGKDAVTVSLRVDNPGADGTKNCVTHQVTIEPGQSRTIRSPLGRADIKLFGMRGYPPESNAGIDPARITALLLFVNKPTADHQWEVSRLRLETATALAGPFFPLIDTFGQYIHRDWPGKTHGPDDLIQKGDQETKDLAQHTGPADWDRYGGWKDGPTLNATGFFRAQKVQDKWWLVDPDGHLFFSQGIDCVLELDPTPIDERQNWFQDFPGDKPEFAAFLSKPFALHGYYASKNPQSFSFAAPQQLRQYGPDWRKVAGELAHQRLRSWGLNTIGNWSDQAVSQLRKTPYVATLGTTDSQTTMIAGSTGYWGKFPDPYAPAFATGMQTKAQTRARQTANDPWCLGYFVDNEMSWGDESSLGLAALQSPPEQPAKKTLINDLTAKYATIAALNAAWGTKLESWDALLASREAVDKVRAKADLDAFYTKTAEAYFAAVKQALALAAPHQMYLGCRFAWVNPLAVKAAAKFCDVVSFNIYQRDVKAFKLPEGVDKPVVIGEFHFGALDRGMFHPGLQSTESQAARAQTYRNYVESALRHPNLVGCHWFKYCDEPTTGRSYDEENYQIGFVDVVDTPYPETVDAARQVGAELYRYRNGK